MKKSISFSEDSITECREALINELLDDSYVRISGKLTNKCNILEDADDEDLSDIVLLLLVDKDLAQEKAKELIKNRFNILYDDSEIEQHLIDEAEDNLLEQHLADNFQKSEVYYNGYFQEHEGY
jgi:hypothetical protein